MPILEEIIENEMNPVSFFKFDSFNQAQDKTFSQISSDVGILHGVDFEINQPSINPIDSFPTSINISPNQLWSINNLNESSPSYIEITNAGGNYSFPNDGKFAIEFLIKKSLSDRARHVPTISTPNNNFGYGSSATVHSPIISKGDLLNVYFIDGNSTTPTDKLVVELFNANLVLNYNKKFAGITTHIVINYDIVQISSNQWKQLLQVYINGEKREIENLIFGTSVPDSSSPASFFIGANGDRLDNLTELNTESLIVNHLSIFDRVLLEPEIIRLYSKSISQQLIINEDYPVIYYPFSDPTNSDIITAEVGIDGDVFNKNLVTSLIQNTVNSTPGIFLQSGSTIILNSTWNPNYDFYLEFFIRTSSSNGRIITSSEEIFPNYGAIISLINGNLEFRRSHNSSSAISSKNISDNEFHHIGIKQFDETVEIFVDRVLSVTALIPKDSIFDSTSRKIKIGGHETSEQFFINQFSIFGNRADFVSGNIETTFNRVFLDSLEPFPSEKRLDLRLQSGETYCVRVTVYIESELAGDNITARVYNHFSGELLFSTNIVNGILEFRPITNTPIDIIFLDLNDNSVIVQVLSNLIPTEIN